MTATTTANRPQALEQIVTEDRRRSVAAHGEERAASVAQCRAIRNTIAHPMVPEGPRIHARIALRNGIAAQAASRLLYQLGRHIEGEAAPAAPKPATPREPRAKLPPVRNDANTAELHRLAVAAHGEAAATLNQIGRLEQMVCDAQGPADVLERAADSLDGGLSFAGASELLDLLKGRKAA